jgi:hypothetical protein
MIMRICGTGKTIAKPKINIKYVKTPGKTMPEQHEWDKPDREPVRACLPHRYLPTFTHEPQR